MRGIQLSQLLIQSEFDGAPGAAKSPADSTGIGPSDRWPAALSSVLRLLHDAGQALPVNKNAAQHCIEQAAALLRTDSSHCCPGSATRGQLAPWQVARVTAFVDANLAEKLDNDALAVIARLSTSHFARAFRATVGMTPHAFVMRRRIARAQELIRSTAKPLAEIALACGLADQAHLTKLFRRIVGLSPSAWRRLRGAAPEERGAIVGPSEQVQSPPAAVRCPYGLVPSCPAIGAI